MSDPAKSEERQPAASSGEARPEPPAALKFGIIHILIWMAGIGLILALLRDAQPINPGFASSWPTYRQWVHVAQSMVYGAGLAGFSLFYFYWRCRSPYPRHPGHWLLLLIGIIVVVEAYLFVVLPTPERFLEQDWDYDAYRMRRLSQSITYFGVECSVLIVASRFMMLSRDRVWALMLIGAALILIADFGATMFGLGVIPGFGSPETLNPVPSRMFFYFARFTLPQLGAIAACLVDAFTRTRRDWAHWLGAVCFVLAGVLGWASQIWRLLPMTVVP